MCAPGGFDASIDKWRVTSAWTGIDAIKALAAERFTSQDPERYLGIIATSGRDLFDRDTAPGAEPEEVMGVKAPSLIIPGDDSSHATSGARYLRELLPKSEFWNVMPPEQTTQKICDRILEFCRTHG